MGRYWNTFKKWAYPEGNWNVDSVYLTNAKITSYLNAPLITPFGALKEEATKFIVNRYHIGKFWLHELVDVTPVLISYITGLPANGDLFLISTKNPTLLEELIGSKASKNSKGVMINDITNMEVKWTTIIVSICLTNFGWPFDVK